MSVQLTDRTNQVLQRPQLQPQLVLEIDGISTIFTATIVSRVVRIGDEELEIGDEWQIGGLRTVGDQSDAVSVSMEGSSSEINQQLNPDRGAISSISSMKVSLVDLNDAATQLITPGEYLDDIMGARARVWLGFKGTSYPEDFVTIFRGIIDDIESPQGAIVLNIAHPDQKKRNSIYERGETELDGPLNNSDTTITVLDTSKFLIAVNGPDGSPDPSLKFYIKIDDEIIKYTGKTATTFTGCTRGDLGTVADSHDDETSAQSFYRLTGNGVELALKLMLSGWNGPFQEDVPVTSFNYIDIDNNVPNAMFFYRTNVKERYGLNEGDYCTTEDAANGANNVTSKIVQRIEVLDQGSYVILEDVAFVDEPASTGKVHFRSQYDTLGEGLQLHGDEVDVEGHLIWFNRYLSSFDMDFYLKDTIEGKEFIEKQLYLPMGGYSLPRKSRASMGYHSSPIPTEKVLVIDADNVTNPKQLKLRRSMGKNFYNTVIYQFDMDTLEDKYLSGHVHTDADSLERIKVGSRPLVIKADGMRRSSLAANLAESVALKILNRYKFAAEFIENVGILFSEGFACEVGDIVLFDGTLLNISDTNTGRRGAAPRLYEVINKKMNFKTGAVSLSLVNTSFSTSSRYGLISPASKLSSGVSQTQFIIKESFSGIYGANEFRKWQSIIGCSVTVRNKSGSVSGTAVLQSLSGNTVTVATALGFVPAEDYIMELSHYNNQTDVVKLLYTFMTDAPTFDDGEDQYRMI